MEAHPSGGVASLSLRHGVRCVPDADSNVEDVLVAVGEQIGYKNIISASRMNKAVVVFLKEESVVRNWRLDKWNIYYCFTACVAICKSYDL